MSIPTRPTDHPDWATNATHTVGPNVGQPNKIALTIEATEGNVDGIGYPPAARKFNLWQNLVGLWVRWFEAFLDYIWARQLPVPEDYLGLETAAEVDAAGTWHAYINAMLTAAAASSSRACGMTAGRDYKCSGEISFPLGVRLWDCKGAAITGNYDAIGVDIDNVHPSYWVEVRNLTLKQNNANSSFAWRLNNCSYIRLTNCSVVDYGTAASAATNDIIGFAITASANNHHLELVRPWVDDIRGDGTGSNQATGISILPSGSLRHTINVIDPIVTGYGGTKVAMTIDGVTKGVTVTNPQFRGLFGGAFTIGYSGAATEAAIECGYIVDADLAGIYCLGTGRVDINGTHVDACGGGYASIGEGAVSSGNTGLVRGRGVVVTRAGKTSANVARSATSANGFYSPTTFQSNWDLQGCHVDGSEGYNYRLLGVKTAKVQNCTGKNPGYGLGVDTASFFVEGKSDAVSFVSIKNNIAHAQATGRGGGFSIVPADYDFPVVGDVTDNSAHGNGVALGTGLSIIVDGVVERNNVYNYDIACWTLGNTSAGDALGHTCFIQNNTWHTCGIGLLTDTSSGSQWLFAGGNTCINVTTPYSHTGAGAGRVKEAIQLFPTRIIRSDAAPIATEGTWTFGDEIRPATTAITTDEVARFCTVSGDPGTWKRVIAIT